jgi:hypothetical protein
MSGPSETLPPKPPAELLSNLRLPCRASEEEENLADLAPILTLSAREKVEPRHWRREVVKPRRAARVRAQSPRRFRQKWEDTYAPHGPCLKDALGWSSEEWSKASGRATVRLDQIRTRLPMSIRIHSDYLGALHIATGTSSPFGYLNNEDDRLVESCGRNPHLYKDARGDSAGRTLIESADTFRLDQPTPDFLCRSRFD